MMISTNFHHFLAFSGESNQELIEPTIQVHFEKKYNLWKNSLSIGCKNNLEKYESNFRAEAMGKLVFIFHLTPGQTMCFHASTVLHSTIVQSNDDKTPRQLLIFHRMHN